MRRPIFILAAGTVLLAAWWLAAGPADPPRFTEERAAAALAFVHKHLPELGPVLELLRKDRPERYQREIREIFQETEVLAELRDDPKRHDLELTYWKTENRAFLLAARLARSSPEDRPKLQEQLAGLARNLVDLDLQGLQLKAARLESDLARTKETIAKARETVDQQAKTRLEMLMNKAKEEK